MGFAEQSGVPLRMGLIRNHYVGRTFIQPQQSIRHFGVKVKLNPVRSILDGRRVVLVDDSLVRGTTSQKIVKMVRAAGAKEVHVRISCPPTISPCFYGVDTPRKSELIAATHTIEEIREFLEADSVAYLSLEGLLSAVKTERSSYCTVVLHRQLSGPGPAATRRRIFSSRSRSIPRASRWRNERRQGPRSSSSVCPLCTFVSSVAARARARRSRARRKRSRRAQLQAAIAQARATSTTRHGRTRPARCAVPPAPRRCRRCCRPCAEQADGYVRYRALDPADRLQRSADEGRDARVAGQPERSAARAPPTASSSTTPIRAMVPQFLTALDKEQGEFVRPELVRARSPSPRRRRARASGAAARGRSRRDFFRSAVIEALGDHKALYAFDALTAIAKLDGPLQDDAALALGRLGDKRALETLAAIQRTRAAAGPAVDRCRHLPPRRQLRVAHRAISLDAPEVLRQERRLSGTAAQRRGRPRRRRRRRPSRSGASRSIAIGVPSNDDTTRAPVALALATVALPQYAADDDAAREA